MFKLQILREGGYCIGPVILTKNLHNAISSIVSLDPLDKDRKISEESIPPLPILIKIIPFEETVNIILNPDHKVFFVC